MTREQFLLLKVAEECQEVAKRAIKSIQFGSSQVWKGGEVEGGVGPNKDQGVTNADRLHGELKDLAVIVNIMVDSDYLSTFDGDYIEYEKFKEAKIAKLNKYVAFARSLGQIDGDWTV